MGKRWEREAPPQLEWGGLAKRGMPLALAGLLTVFGVAWVGSRGAWAAATDAPGGKLVVSYRSGEILYDEDQNTVMAPPPALGVQYEGQTLTQAPGLPQVTYEGYLASEASNGARGGLSLRADWLPAASRDRRYTVATALSQRPGSLPAAPPERAWDLSAALHEGGPGGAAVEAGGQIKSYRDRLVGRDYRQTSAYLGTKVNFSGPLAGLSGPDGFLSYLDPGWLRGFAALLTPLPEPGAEHGLPLPDWFAGAAIGGLPLLPDGAFPELGEGTSRPGRSSPGRLSVTARHTRTARTYLEGDAGSDWGAGESMVELRQSAGGRSAVASFVDTLKEYPGDSDRSYRLQEGELAYAFPVGPTELKASAGFRRRTPWIGAGETYRQEGASLGIRFPFGADASLRLGGDWRWRRYDGDPGHDYRRSAAEAEVAWRRCAVTFSHTSRHSIGGEQSLGGRWRLGLAAGLPLAPGQQIDGGIAWEQSWGAPEDGVPEVGPVTFALRLQWTRRF